VIADDGLGDALDEEVQPPNPIMVRLINKAYRKRVCNFNMLRFSMLAPVMLIHIIIGEAIQSPVLVYS
jgi:hypothetical protein